MFVPQPAALSSCHRARWRGPPESVPAPTSTRGSSGWPAGCKQCSERLFVHCGLLPVNYFCVPSTVTLPDSRLPSANPHLDNCSKNTSLILMPTMTSDCSVVDLSEHSHGLWPPLLSVLTTSISVLEWPMLQTMQPFFMRSRFSLTTTFLLPGRKH